MVDESRIDDVESTLRDSYFTKMLTLRDAQDPSKLYLNVKKFQSRLPGPQTRLRPLETNPIAARPQALAKVSGASPVAGRSAVAMKTATALLLAVCLCYRLRHASARPPSAAGLTPPIRMARPRRRRRGRRVLLAHERPAE